MSYRDYFVIVVVLCIITWKLRGPMAGLWRRVTAPSAGASDRSVWRRRLMLATIIVPPACIVIINAASLGSWGPSFCHWIESLPVLGWTVYAAWIYKRTHRWASIATYGGITLLSGMLTFLAAGGTYLAFPGLASSVNWNFRLLYYPFEFLNCFTTFLIMAVASRFFRFHLVHVDESTVETPRMTIPFMLLTQGLLAAVITLTIWLTRINREALATVSDAAHISFHFSNSAVAAMIALAIFMPSRWPRWAFAVTLVAGAAVMRSAVVYMWYQEMLLTEDLQVVPTPNQLLEMMFWSTALDLLFELIAMALIGVSFRKLGLEIRGVREGR